ncbi:MAG TPA: hypothetical protein P5050_12315 [Bacteroidia bacterium]|nr:hypothetical protein [Bacteroidia bacterium]HRS59989.1 hypothetical protein [Bacteroidia bacterium]HRU68803.1 hypothetical protein [Bacteroidia bacterium]
MKAFKVTFQHGHFIDTETGKRLIPVQGAEYHIIADSEAFKSEDVKLKFKEPLNAADKLAWAKSEFGEGNFIKILDAGSPLFFRIGNSKKVEGDESSEYIFTCIILEDLYIFKIKSRQGDKMDDWRLADCICRLDKCLLGGMTLSEKLQAQSLSMLFGFTVMFYFSLQRSASCNAFNTFFLYQEGMNISFEGIKNGLYESLNHKREEALRL